MEPVTDVLGEVRGRARFDGLRVMITGAGSGIGRATAIRFAAEGAQIGLVDRSQDALDRVADEIARSGGQPLRLVADCSIEEEVIDAFGQFEASFRGIDALIANAGIELPDVDDVVHKLSLEGWNTLISNNLTGQFLTSKHAIKLMLPRGAGSVVCIGSNLGNLGMAYEEPAYSASKGGAFALVKAMAIAYARHGIRVNMVIPGFISTPMNRFVLDDPDLLEYWSDKVPLGRPGTAEEVASAILWLTSSEASYCVGTALIIDGGQSSI
jgi:NAD(P)-dependent dehydrogenase (short-subunit alcohol dehydrogenase family)